MVVVGKKQVLAILIPPDTPQVDIEQESGIRRSAFPLRMELSAENGPRLMNHSFVRRVASQRESLRFCIL